jgi:predicted nucleotide-binding protein (sugar kinase/HSP70/actin superfamily)
MANISSRATNATKGRASSTRTPISIFSPTNIKSSGKSPLKSLRPAEKSGLPLALAMYEQLPFWEAFFSALGYQVVLNDESSRELYFKGQNTIASDTVCYPAKLMHGCIASLLEKGVDFIFYPAESYNFDEKKGDNHFNCPVVAYYSELLNANNPALKEKKILNPYLDISNEGRPLPP